ncbi:MAG TPA: hypothetical protein VGL86_17485 [Polyangia bacterium]|jgi:hypothetical protein
MQNGRDHEEREQKFGTRVEQQERRDQEAATEGGIEELDRRARSDDPAPTEKAAESERARHGRERSKQILRGVSCVASSHGGDACDVFEGSYSRRWR